MMKKPPKLTHSDTPSHTVREHYRNWYSPFFRRYTLTYSEGTHNLFAAVWLPMIHPHIQWGNIIMARRSSACPDTPSHTVRERNPFPLITALCRYTLTYSEGTALRALFMPFNSIHPHIQWGNTQYLRGFQPLQIPCCAICTKAFCHPRHIFNMPKNLIC